MSPAVEAALIAAGVGLLTVAGTLYGTRRTSRDTKKILTTQLAEQREQLHTTLAAQREQLDTTLAEQREQLDRTLAQQRDRTLNERFATAADRLGSDKPPAVRLAGVYAMAGLADDWPENRQTCVDILCAYLRLPYDPDPGDDAEPDKRGAYLADREVRHTIIRLIGAHLRSGATVSWQGLSLDFTGVVFDGGDFAGARFSKIVRFNGTSFVGGRVNFSTAEFSGGAEVIFDAAEFSGGEVSFRFAKFSGGHVSFEGAKFSGGDVSFDFAVFSRSSVNFNGTMVSRGTVSFFGAVFSGGMVYFQDAVFSDGDVSFRFAVFSGGDVSFNSAVFSGGTVNFNDAKFSKGTVSFVTAVFSKGTVNFNDAKFSKGTVYFVGAVFSGGTVDFSHAGPWSQLPAFGWAGAPPAGVLLPAEADARDQQPG